MAVSSLRRAADVRMWFAAISLLAIVAANAVLASVLTRFISERIQLREAEIAQEFLAGILKAEGGEAKLFSTPAPSAELISFAEQVRSIPGIVRANIYSPDMFIRFSTEPSLTGLKFDGNSELSDSFRGELVSKIEAVSDIDKSEHIALEQPRGGRLQFPLDRDHRGHGRRGKPARAYSCQERYGPGHPQDQGRRSATGAAAA